MNKKEERESKMKFLKKIANNLDKSKEKKNLEFFEPQIISTKSISLNEFDIYFL